MSRSKPSGMKPTWIAMAAALLLHVLLAVWAINVPEPERKEPKPEKKKPISVRTFTKPKPVPVVVEEELPEPKPEPVVEKPPEPPPEPPKPPEEEVKPPEEQVKPKEKPEKVAKAPEPADEKPKPKRKRKRKRKPKKRSGGKTLTSKNGSARATEAADGKGRVLDYGEWDPDAGTGSAEPQPEEPAAPAAAVAPGPAQDGAAEASAPRKPRGKLVPPVPLSRPSGRYPAGVARSSSPVNVVLSLKVSTSGRVTRVKVVKSGGAALDKEARRVVRKVRFEPATRGGTPVPMTIPWTVTFK